MANRYLCCEIHSLTSLCLMYMYMFFCSLCLKGIFMIFTRGGKKYTQKVYSILKTDATFINNVQRSVARQKGRDLSSITKAPIQTENRKKQSDNTKTPPKTSKRQQLPTDLDLSVVVKTANKLAWLNRFT